MGLNVCFLSLRIMLLIIIIFTIWQKSYEGFFLLLLLLPKFKVNLLAFIHLFVIGKISFEVV
jgi:hypothetical protein